MHPRSSNGLFDEWKQMTQSSFPMKWTGILLVAVACAFFARAQDTNVSAVATNKPVGQFGLPHATNSLSANSRQLSLEECVRIALQHNFTVQIARFNPQIARYNLGGAYGVYDPTFTSGYSHDYNLSPGGIDEQGRPFTGVESDTDNLNAGLSGLLPWGTVYNLGGSASDQTGTRPTTVVTGTNIIGFTTNTVFSPTLTPITLLNPIFPTAAGRTGFETTTATAGALTLSQPLLKNFWIDSDRYTIFFDKKEVEKSVADFKDTLMTVITQVETAYLRLIQANENVANQEKALELADQTVSENKKKVEVGAMAPLDEQQAEAQAAASRAALLKARSDAGTQQRVLKSLLSDNYKSEWFILDVQPKDKLIALPHDFDLQESWRRGLSERGPRLQQLRLTLQENNENIRLQRNQLFPELDVTGSYGYRGTGKEFSDAFGQIQDRSAPFWSVGAQVTIPLSQTVARNNLKAAKAARDQQKLTIQQQEQNTLITIENDIATARSGYETVQATHEARLYAESALEAEQKKYENGKSTLFDILGLQAKLTQARSDEIGALADYNVDIATLAFDEGSTFERHQLDVQPR